MNKYEFVKKVAADAGVSQDVVNGVLKAFVDNLVSEVRDNGENVAIPGLGTFKQKVTSAHEGFNPLTKKKIQVDGSRTIVLKVTPTIKVKD